MIIDRNKSSYALYALDLEGIKTCVHKNSKSPSSLTALDLSGVDHYKKKDIQAARMNFEEIRLNSFYLETVLSWESFSSFSIKRTERKCLSKKNIEIIERMQELMSYQNLYLPFNEYKRIDSSKSLSLTCSELKTLIEPSVEETLDALDYNGLNSLAELAKYLEEHASEKECVAFRRFKASCLNDDVNYQGSSCVGLSLAVLKKLKDKFGIEGDLIIEKKSCQSAFHHGAAIIPCKNGWILIETNNAKGERLILIPPSLPKRHFDSTLKSSTSWSDGSRGKLSPIFYKFYASHRSEYLQTLANADSLVMSKYILRNNFFPVIAYENGKVILAIKIFPVTQKIVFQVGAGNTKSEVASFDFADVDISFKLALERFMNGKFKISADTLYQQITAIVSAKDHIHNLFEQTRVVDRNSTTNLT